MTEPPTDSLVHARGLTKRFDGFTAVDGIDVDVWRGEAFGFLGNPATHFGLAGVWYLLGQQKQDEKTFEVGRTKRCTCVLSAR